MGSADTIIHKLILSAEDFTSLPPELERPAWFEVKAFVYRDDWAVEVAWMRRVGDERDYWPDFKQDAVFELKRKIREGYRTQVNMRRGLEGEGPEDLESA